MFIIIQGASMSQKLGNYTIQEEIGRGGMATVYRAVQESLNRIVALKELELSRFRSEPSALERFRLEARAAAALEHPNIVTIYDLWEEEDKAYIAMEFVDGVELKDVLLNLGSIQYVNAVLIAMAISEALHYAHSKGMVHRDVKPGNIMLSGSGEIRLMDFGIVSVPGAGDLTVTGQILGTPAYMPPEQIAGEELGPGADLFSLGAVLYEMIAGRKPFVGANHVALIQDVLHGQPTPLHELDARVPEAISQAVQKCLEKRPERRFSSMEEFSTVLEMVMPLERPGQVDVVTGLVVNAMEQERTRLHTSAGEDDRTSPMVTTPERPASQTGTTGVGTFQGSEGESGKDTPLTHDPESSVYQLELDPPAELPPLESDGSRTGSFEKKPIAKKSPQSPLTLKDIPELDPDKDEGLYIEETKKSDSRRPIIWIFPVILLAAAAVWFFADGSRKSELLKKGVIPVSEAHITVVADPTGRVFMDGELLGDANPSLVFDVKPGLHRLEVRHTGFDPRKFIVELNPGEEKEIKVKFSE
jgi:serine/threonine-protein kinase